MTNLINFIYLSYVLFAVFSEVGCLILTISKYGITPSFIGNLAVGRALGVFVSFITPITASSIRGSFPYPQITVVAISVFLVLLPLTVINTISVAKREKKL